MKRMNLLWSDDILTECVNKRLLWKYKTFLIKYRNENTTGCQLMYVFFVLFFYLSWLCFMTFIGRFVKISTKTKGQLLITQDQSSCFQTGSEYSNLYPGSVLVVYSKNTASKSACVFGFKPEVVVA